MAAGAEIGLAPTDDHNGARMAGPHLNTLTIKDGKRQTIADAYLAPALGRPNLHLMAETQVLSLVFDGTRCRGARLADRHGERVVTAGRVDPRGRDHRLADAADALGDRRGR